MSTHKADTHAHDTKQPVAESKAAAVDTKPDDSFRPWHGSDNPLESLFLWVRGELEELKGKNGRSSHR